MKDVYAIFICDEWKTRDSHRLIGIATTLTEVRETVKYMLSNGSIESNSDRNVDDMEEGDFQHFNFFHVKKIPLNSIEVNGGYYS